MAAFSYFSHSFMEDLVAHQPTYVGVISSMHKTFGFIRALHATDCFFHQSVCGVLLFDQLKVGDAVSFQLDAQDSKPGKRVASYVARSAQQPVLEHIDHKQQYGRLVRAPGGSATRAAGVLRYSPGPGQVQHLTFRLSDVLEGVSCAQALVPGQPIAFKVLTDQRQQLLLEASGRLANAHVFHAYKRATEVCLVPPDQLVSRSGCVGQREGEATRASSQHTHTPLTFLVVLVSVHTHAAHTLSTPNIQTSSFNPVVLRKELMVSNDVTVYMLTARLYVCVCLLLLLLLIICM